MEKITPSLWFNDEGEEAVKLYTSAFKNSKVNFVSHRVKAVAAVNNMPEGGILTLQFELGGQSFFALNGGPYFKFTQATSLFVACENEKEIDSLWAKLSHDGNVSMDLKKYPFAEKYGWCQDKFGLSWQLILAPRPQKIVPSFLFVKKQAGRAEEAMKFYTSIFKNSQIENMFKDEKTGAILHANFILDGYRLVAMESPVQHDFEFNEALSLMINCDTQEEVDYFWKHLSAVKESEQCGWVKDKFGISWQIVPKALMKMQVDPDPKKVARVMEAMLQMKKLDLKTLEKAYGK